MNIRCESFDQEAALQRHGTTPQLQKRALEILPLCHRSLNIMRLAFTTQNSQILEQTAHDIVSLLGELSPPAALDLALQIEKVARTHNLVDIGATIDRFEEELNKLQVVLNHLS